MMAFWAGQLGAAERTAESAWGELVGDSISRAAYAYVESDPALPNVFIYGDSISIGYTPGVREHLTGHANVYRLHLNGGHSASFVSKFKTLDSTMRDPALAGAWDFEWDVIHFNVGLHDLKYLNEANQLDLENGKQVTTIAEYQAHLRRIIDHLKQAAPRAKLIFALTTKVPAGAKGRIENSELAYNAAALAVLEDFPEIAINDLRTASLPYEQPGNVHFKASGLAAQAEHVAKVIKTHLP
ncbi:MAG: SGNH/GDSL hydrolase family protein [Synoicihabitans sp.]